MIPGIENYNSTPKLWSQFYTLLMINHVSFNEAGFGYLFCIYCFLIKQIRENI